jgi:hypothetical protein
MIKRYDHPLKRRLWRPAITKWLRSIYTSPERRKNISAVCLPGAELDEVTGIYDRLGVREVVCVEINNDHFRRMEDVKSRRLREGKISPKLTLVEDDVREFLRTTRERHDIVFLDFDGNDHLVVEECGRLIASRDLLPEFGGVFGVNVLGSREHLEHQLAIRARAGDRLTQEESAVLVMETIARDPIVSDIVENAERLIPRLQAVNGEHDLTGARGIYYTNLVLRSMFRGKGLEELTEKLAEDHHMGPILKGYSEDALGQLGQIFRLEGIDTEALERRIRELVAEVAMFDIDDVKEYLKWCMEDFISFIQTAKKKNSMLRIRKLDPADCVHYLAAKSLRPYLCSRLLKLKYTWGRSPMLTDAGFFKPVTGFEEKLGAFICNSANCKRPTPHILMTYHDGATWFPNDSKSVRTVGRELRNYRKKFERLCEQNRAGLLLDDMELDPSLPVLTSKEQVRDIVRRNPIVTPEEIFENYNIMESSNGKTAFMSCNQVWAIIRDTLISMGRKPLTEANKERFTVRLIARIERGWSDERLYKELYASYDIIRKVRGFLLRGDYREGGSCGHLMPYVVDETRRLVEHERSASAESREEGPASFVYSEFSEWVELNIVRAVELKRLSVDELQRIHAANLELSTESQGGIRNILLGFSEYEPYEINPVELFRIAGALKKLDACNEDILLLERIIDTARFKFAEVTAAIDGLGSESFERRTKKKKRIHFENRNLLYAAFGYRSIIKCASRKLKDAMRK